MPDEDNKTLASKKAEPVTRLADMQARKIDVSFPNCSAVYLAEYLWEIGPTASNGMGEGPISHSEIAAWQQNIGIELTSWEAGTLRSLSVAYLMESHKARKPACPSPLVPELDGAARVDVAKRVKSALRE